MSDVDATAGALRVAMVAPPWFDVPPQGYGGIEQMLADLIGGLVARGHKVTLVGAGRDGTAANFEQTYAKPPSERLGEPVPEVLHAAAAARILDDLDVGHNLDIVHDHTLAGPLTATGRTTPTVATMHGPVDGEYALYFRQLGSSVALVALSEAQRRMAPDLNWVATVPNGIDVATYPYREDKEDWTLFVGRFSPEKGAHLAIDAARGAGRRILLAGKLSEPVEEEYFEREIRPRLGDDAKFIGETDAEGKRELYAKAACLLFPVQWEEPFGLVMVEAMACGTPVVALAEGSVPEVVVDGRTGFVRDSPDELSAAVARISEIRAADCRAHVAEHFDVDVMVTGYERVYRQLTTEPDPI
jgi:glycosyltransferase involved in cell wall biosynthesis